jgi:hypothetical protein
MLTEIWKGWDRSTGERREADTDTKKLKERKK